MRIVLLFTQLVSAFCALLELVHAQPFVELEMRFNKTFEVR